MEIPDDGDGKGGYCCFACGRSMNPGESFVCVSRLWQILGDGSINTEVIDAVASLQVCIPCTLSASRINLKWTHQPQLVISEFHGFYAYASRMTDAIAGSKSDTRMDEWPSQNVPFSLGEIPIYLPDIDATTIEGHNETPIQLLVTDQCRHCFKMIDRFRPSMLIEIEINIPRHECMGIFDTLQVAQYCNDCSRQMFKITRDGRMGI
ncbi:hypothetical protein ACFLTW_01620 [Chloroflexota bacterium]